ncbi:hypothetical protein lerEdw1_011574 [Lerista edwardsae]|nr:hypothetical protein lerEdw1_011574 [Lerista edwardsae]
MFLFERKNKDQRKRLVHEICTFLDSSQSVQEIDALRTENRKLKNAYEESELLSGQATFLKTHFPRGSSSSRSPASPQRPK